MGKRNPAPPYVILVFFPMVYSHDFFKVFFIGTPKSSPAEICRISLPHPQYVMMLPVLSIAKNHLEDGVRPSHHTMWGPQTISWCKVHDWWVLWFLVNVTNCRTIEHSWGYTKSNKHDWGGHHTIGVLFPETQRLTKLITLFPWLKWYSHTWSTSLM